MIKVAAVQMTSTPDLEGNLKKILEFMKEAKGQEADLVAFPEMSLLLAERPVVLEKAFTLRSEAISEIRKLADELDLWVHLGSLPLRIEDDPSRVTNTSLIINGEGGIAARYHKVHLLIADIENDRSYDESETYRAGTYPVTFEREHFRFGCSICYDLRFPEHFRLLSDRNVDAYFIPAAFTVPTGIAHWDVLTRARAIENQAYVVAASQVGTHYDGRQTYGHTRIIHPYGDVLAELENEEGVVSAVLSKEEIQSFRRRIPALQHRRLKDA